MARVMRTQNEKKASNDEKGKGKKKENLLNEEREKSYEKHIFSHIHFRAVRSKAVKSGKKKYRKFFERIFSSLTTKTEKENEVKKG